eukprot:13774648-Alexandrium_andersonii.AAC.1
MADIRSLLIDARHGVRAQTHDAGPRSARGGAAACGTGEKASGVGRFCGRCQDGHREGGWRGAREK